jgi:hypothetical protein
MNIVADEHIAFAHWLAHCGGTNDKGETQACWMRVTACYRREAGQWRIVHEHWSAPFDMMSGAACSTWSPERRAVDREAARNGQSTAIVDLRWRSS